MKAEDAKTFGRLMRSLGKDMIDNPQRYLDLEARFSPSIDVIYDFMGMAVGAKKRDREEIIIVIKRNMR